MGKKKKSDYKFSSDNLFVYIYKRFRFLFAISMVALIASVIVSLLITPRFRSTVVLFPATTTSVAKTLLGPAAATRTGVLDFGEEEETERLLQVLHSTEIRDRIVEKYDLMSHYDISPNEKFRMTKLHKKFKSNIKFRRTEFMSIEIDVLDEDPEMAANIANDIAALLDSTINRMRRERALAALEIVEREYFNLRDEIKSLEDSLAWIMRQGVNDYESMSEVINAAYANALLAGNRNAAQALKEQVDLLSKHGSSYVAITSFLDFQREHLSRVSGKYMEAKVEAEQNLPHKFIVDDAFPAEKKSYPLRSLIVIISTLSTFLLALIASMIYDNIRKNIL